jgi:TPR repeat protein
MPDVKKINNNYRFFICLFFIHLFDKTKTKKNNKHHQKKRSMDPNNNTFGLGLKYFYGYGQKDKDTVISVDIRHSINLLIEATKYWISTTYHPLANVFLQVILCHIDEYIGDYYGLCEESLIYKIQFSIIIREIDEDEIFNDTLEYYNSHPDEYIAQVALGWLLMSRYEPPKDPHPNPFELITKAAQQSPIGQYYLGRCYYNGLHGIPVNKQLGLHWIRLAAEEGKIHPAQMFLGDLYRYCGGPLIFESIKYYSMADETNNCAISQEMLGHIYAYNSDLMYSNSSEYATKFYKKRVKNGLIGNRNDIMAQYRLGTDAFAFSGVTLSKNISCDLFYSCLE